SDVCSFDLGLDLWWPQCVYQCGLQHVQQLQHGPDHQRAYAPADRSAGGVPLPVSPDSATAPVILREPNRKGEGNMKTGGSRALRSAVAAALAVAGISAVFAQPPGPPGAPRGPLP